MGFKIDYHGWVMRLGLGITVGYQGLVSTLGTRNGSQRWVKWLDPYAGTHGLVLWMGHHVGSHDWSRSLGPKVES